MVFSSVLLVWLLLLTLLIPLQIKPEFVVKELELCCHHKIHLKCKGSEKIAIIQSRYVVAAAEEPKVNPYRSSRKIPPGSVWSAGSSSSWDGAIGINQTDKSYLSLWDMDIQFTHDLNHPQFPIRHDFSSLNTPEWAIQHRVVNRGRRYTTPNPLLHGLKFTSQRILEMPPYDPSQDNILDKETVWAQPLFALVKEENEIRRLGPGGGGSVSAISGRTNVRLKTSGFGPVVSAAGSEPVEPCFSYETLAEDDEYMGVGNRGFESRRRKWPRPQWHYKDLRPVFNRRCSGRSECVVNLMRNKLRDQDLTSVCQKWPEGRILVKYLCFNSFSGDVHSKCNEDLGSASEGFILNPGYPEIYAGDNPCQWRLSLSEPQQKILLLFLDISLRGEEKSKCRDRIVVSEGGTRLLSTCGDHSSALGILSSSNTLNVTFTPESRLAFPKRGFLLYFRVGCSDPEEPLNSYLVFRNGSHALFHCEPGYAFPDSMSDSRWLACNPAKHAWNNGFLHCQETGMNLSMMDPASDFPWPSTTSISDATVMRDIAFPIGLILIVFVLNVFLLLWIHRKKRLIEADPEIQNDMNQGLEEGVEEVHSPTTPDEEESTFTLSSGGFEMASGSRPWIFQPPHHHEDSSRETTAELSDDQSRTPLAHQLNISGGSGVSGKGALSNGDLSTTTTTRTPSTSSPRIVSNPVPPDSLSQLPSIHRLPRSTAV